MSSIRIPADRRPATPVPAVGRVVGKVMGKIVGTALSLAAAALLMAPGWTPARAAAASDAPTITYISLPAGTLRSALARDGEPGPSRIAAFALRRTPVTVGEFRAFLGRHPEWAPGSAPGLLADAGYLRHGLSAGADPSPVTEVSWFAAQAFCEAEGEHAGPPAHGPGRLPTWLEWEYAAAADATRADARDDPVWLATILGWYARPTGAQLPAVGRGPANVYGVQDLHGLVWEWVEDAGALLVDADSRSGEDPDRLKFCGAGAINLQDRQNYAVLMRIALLTSLEARQSTRNLGFRCARSLE
jgi:formylglycine-generating enzyme required for sulfatase activity